MVAGWACQQKHKHREAKKNPVDSLGPHAVVSTSPYHCGLVQTSCGTQGPEVDYIFSQFPARQVENERANAFPFEFAIGHQPFGADSWRVEATPMV